MGRFLDRLKAFFPTIEPYRREANKIQKDVEELKTLTMNGEMDFFIARCKEHKDEVCNDTTE